MKSKIIRNILPILGVLSAPAMAGSSGGVDIAANMSVLFDLAGFIAGVIGVFLLAGGLYSFYSWSKGNGQGKSPGAAALTMLIGTILASIGWFYQVIKGSFVGSSSEGVSITDSGGYSLALDKAAASAAASVAGSGFGKFMPESTIKAVLAFVFLVGFIAFISGFFSLKDVGDNRGSQHPILSPIVKIVGGVICMNITWFSCMLSGTLGIAALCSGS
jgi:hypothetical protein